MGLTASKLRAAAKKGDEAEVKKILADKSDKQRVALLRSAATHNGE